MTMNELRPTEDLQMRKLDLQYSFTVIYNLSGVNQIKSRDFVNLDEN